MRIPLSYDTKLHLGISFFVPADSKSFTEHNASIHYRGNKIPLYATVRYSKYPYLY